MARINTNVQSLVAQRVLGNNNLGLGQALERLSTGLRINRGKDDPAGLIASENLRSEQKSLGQAVANADRADQVLNIAEGGLQEVSTLLTELQGILTASASEAGLSAEEKAANQLQVDSILQTIDRVAGATNFQGIKLLNGNFDFTTSGINAANVTDYKINAAKFSGDSLNVNVAVTRSAQQAGMFLSLGATALDLSSGTAQFVLEIGGTKGSREFSFSSGTTITAMRDAINQFSDVTGITATTSGNGIRLVSDEYGDNEFVSVKSSSSGGIDANSSGIYNLQATNFNAANTTEVANFSAASNPVRDNGQDIRGTINGVVATGEGRNLSLATDFLDVTVTLGTTASRTLGTVGGTGTPTMTITGGGANFQLASKVDINGQVSMGIQDVAARKLGNSTTGFLSSLASGKANNVVDGDISDAQKVVGEAIKQVSGLRGRLGAFQKNTVGATIRSLGVNIENTAAAQSVIRDADFAAETANLTRSQILVSASTNILGIANSQPQSALQLLG
ncbi:MAG TPA: flagellin [Phycisphaerales bacterium]|nr:flagellin [Phycisphaerales bacterium]